MTGFGVDRERLPELVRELARCGGDLAEVEAQVEAQVARLHASWHGEAAALHVRAHRHWAEGARQTRAALALLRDVAQTAEGNYASAVGANVQMWDR